MEVNKELTYTIRGIIFRVHKELGPGLLGRVYEEALLYEFSKAGLAAEAQVAVPVNYHSVKLDMGFRLDILIENCVILEIKSVSDLLDVHKKQLLTYLKLSNKPLGFLINFNSSFLIDRESIIRIIN
ncbi:GxxExxY protein [Echinicola strongylocentroti]|uniref:GxxExxY protein n=1 Tax=Echinicola strongylocentroti TaxID=1795355 RepID=A0A2Z4IF85_9BACT|nr:GxxExxY protein [Echinicola strongylocentroti]AWW29336.1 GxxExxY protein [Echinicola strongylocentroti]